MAKPNVFTIVLLLILLELFPQISANGHGRSYSAQDLRQIIEEIRAGNTAHAEALKAVAAFDISMLRGYLSDPDESVREAVTLAFAEARNEEAIPIMVDRLSDSSPQIRNIAMTCLWLFPRSTIFCHLSKQMIDAMGEYAWKLNEKSDLAVLVLGDRGDPSWTKELRRLRAFASEIHNPFDTQGIGNAPRAERACWMALVKLGDPEGITQLKRMTAGKEISGRARAADCIAYASRRELSGLLLPLLDDRRGAEEPFHSPLYTLRVCDLAATAAASVTGAAPETFNRLKRYDDSEIEQIRARLRKAMALTKDMR